MVLYFKRNTSNESIEVKYLETRGKGNDHILL